MKTTEPVARCSSFSDGEAAEQRRTTRSAASVVIDEERGIWHELDIRKNIIERTHELNNKRRK